MTQEERERYINDHINNYKMSREEAEAVVDGMTDAEVEVARRHGIGRKEETLDDIMARVQKNRTATPAAITLPSPVIDIEKCFFECVRRLCAARQRTFEATADFVRQSAAVVKWIASARKGYKWLLLYGNVGNGKSTAARAALITLRQLGVNCTEKNAYDIALLYREVNRNQRAADEYDRLCRCNLLFVDDLGTENNPAALNELLYERYNQMRLTIFTTNLSRAELAAKYGPRIFDRFEELAMVLSFAGGSFRARNRQMELAL
jgi:DNA replication protein DnaC